MIIYVQSEDDVTFSDQAFAWKVGITWRQIK